MKITTIGKLKVGQRYQEIPKPWYGPAKLIEKVRRDQMVWNHQTQKMIKRYIYDLVFDAKVVNPPGIQYGVPRETKVQLLAKRRKK